MIKSEDVSVELSSSSEPAAPGAVGGGGLQPLQPSLVVYSLFLFLLAGLLEIGGGWLMWHAIRQNGNKALFIILGSVVLIAYGLVPTLQPLQDFGRIYAVYGGFFIALSYLWGYLVDGFKPDLGDLVGSIVAIAGVLICWFWPRANL
jgi:drug/metabolite transporter superfamily protein YnfA